MSSNTSPSELTRRNFLKLGLGALGGLVTLEVGGAGLLFLQPASLEGSFGGLVTAGAVDSFPAGSVTHFPDGRFYLVRTQDGGFLAVYSRCTHLGCNVEWKADQDHFFCPCHASTFDSRGDVENPPAPRALDTFPVRIDAGQVLVDTGQIEKREQFVPEQLAYA